ncbi:MAG: hypothetical protein JZU65_22395 [Chlorobium sp.]|nr:hypothetical protein [Chlorobium sp.]
MRRHLIPRRDHEIYFLDLSGEQQIKKHDLHRKALDLLVAHHPGFSIKTRFETKIIKVLGKDWVMITVMEEETLAEYRILHPKTAFYTRTSLLFTQRNFPIAEPKSYGEEKIGIDQDRQFPISEPCVEKNTTENGSEEIVSCLETAPLKSRVFSKPFPRTPMVLLFFLLLLTSLTGALIRPQTDSFTKTNSPTEPEQPVLLPDFPSVPYLLNEIANQTASAGGVIRQLLYDEMQHEALLLIISDCEPSSMSAKLNTIKYLLPVGISDIQYIAGMPLYTLRYSLNNGIFSIPAKGISPDIGSSLELLAALRKLARTYMAQVHFEKNPNATSQNAYTSIQVDVSAATIAHFLTDLDALLAEKSMRIRKMSIQANKGSRLFFLEYAFEPCGACSNPTTLLQNANTRIPEAFGILPIKTQPQSATQVPAADLIKVGSIKMNTGRSLVYYKSPEGKIVTKEE